LVIDSRSRRWPDADLDGQLAAAALRSFDPDRAIAAVQNIKGLGSSRPSWWCCAERTLRMLPANEKRLTAVPDLGGGRPARVLRGSAPRRSPARAVTEIPRPERNSGPVIDGEDEFRVFGDME